MPRVVECSPEVDGDGEMCLAVNCHGDLQLSASDSLTRRDAEELW